MYQVDDSIKLFLSCVAGSRFPGRGAVEMDADLVAAAPGQAAEDAADNPRTKNPPTFRRTSERQHMATSKSDPTLAALNAQIAALQAQANALRKNEMAEVIAKAKHAILRYGLTAADLGFGKAAGNVGKSSAAVGGKPVKRRRKNAAAKPAAKAVKFKDDQGHTWGGIGKRPDWFKAALAAGKTPEGLLAKR